MICQYEIVRREGYSRLTAAVQVVDILVRFAPKLSDEPMIVGVS
jgi:hypothetical protein